MESTCQWSDVSIDNHLIYTTNSFTILLVGTYKLKEEAVCKEVVKKSLEIGYRLIGTWGSSK